MNTDTNFELALQFLSDLDKGRQDFAGIDLRDAILERLTLKKGSIFQSANFQRCRLNFSMMTACNFNAAKFDGANLLRVMFAGSHLRRASFLGANLTHANFMKCRLFNADFRRADLSGANLAQADLRGADFREAVLSQVELRGAFYDANTRFDAAIVPASLHMRLVKPKQDSPDASATSQLTYRGAVVEAADPQPQPQKKAKKPVMMFRGAVQEEPEEAPTQQPAAQENAPKKVVRTYRGVPIE